MSFVTLAIRTIGILSASLLIGGCSSGLTIPQERLGDYALLVPRQNDSSIVSEIDGHMPGLSLAGEMKNVLPGKHTIQTYSCYGAGTNTCRPDLYTFDVKPGMAYVFRGTSTIEVYDRFNIGNVRLGTLHETAGRVFVNDQQFAAMQSSADKQKSDAQAAIMELRTLNLPLVRKIGARICQMQDRGVLYIGYVEGITDEKVQIRIADAVFPGAPGVRPGGFSPTIIWDSPMRWDLCN